MTYKAWDTYVVILIVVYGIFMMLLDEHSPLNVIIIAMDIHNIDRIFVLITYKRMHSDYLPSRFKAYAILKFLDVEVSYWR